MGTEPEGRVVVVTGAAGGIGEAYARAIAQAGAQGVVADLDEAGAERVATTIRETGGNATPVHVDIASNTSCAAAPPERASTPSSLKWR